MFAVYCFYSFYCCDILLIVFGNELWQRLSTDSFHYPNGLIEKYSSKGINLPLQRNYLWPNTNGRGRSNIYDNLYFAGFDQGYLGGLTIGVYSWGIGEEIACKLEKINKNECEIPWVDV